MIIDAAVQKQNGLQRNINGGGTRGSSHKFTGIPGVILLMPHDANNDALLIMGGRER